jgi:hypothetical protein
MRARRISTGSAFRLFEEEREIGYVDHIKMRFHGFATREEAALAASMAHRALTRRRGEQESLADRPGDVYIMEQGSTLAVVARAGVLATLLPAQEKEAEAHGWGFEIPLLPEEQFEIFSVARARVIWRALRDARVHQRMRQFARPTGGPVQAAATVDIERQPLAYHPAAPGCEGAS